MKTNETSLVGTPEGRIGAVPFAPSDPTSAAAWLVDGAASGRLSCAIRLSNAYCVALAQKDKGYANLFSSGGVTFADGFPMAMFVRAFGGRSSRRVRGPSLFLRVLDEGRGRSVRHFIVGGTPRAIPTLIDFLNESFPGIRVAGAYSPPFAPVDDAYLNQIAEEVERSDAEIVWINLGTPKQDFVAQYLAQRLGLPAVGVGAAFDFTTGTVREAPHWMRRVGLEWLYRLAVEPKRLWRSYLIGNLVLLAVAIESAMRITLKLDSE